MAALTPLHGAQPARRRSEAIPCPPRPGDGVSFVTMDNDEICPPARLRALVTTSRRPFFAKARDHFDDPVPCPLRLGVAQARTSGRGEAPYPDVGNARVEQGVQVVCRLRRLFSP